MASRLDVGSHQGANVLPADDDTGLMETTQHEVIQRSLCRKRMWVPFEQYVTNLLFHLTLVLLT